MRRAAMLLLPPLSLLMHGRQAGRPPTTHSQANSSPTHACTHLVAGTTPREPSAHSTHSSTPSAVVLAPAQAAAGRWQTRSASVTEWVSGWVAQCGNAAMPNATWATPTVGCSAAPRRTPTTAHKSHQGLTSDCGAVKARRQPQILGLLPLLRVCCLPLLPLLLCPSLRCLLPASGCGSGSRSCRLFRLLPLDGRASLHAHPGKKEEQCVNPSAPENVQQAGRQHQPATARREAQASAACPHLLLLLLRQRRGLLLLLLLLLLCVWHHNSAAALPALPRGDDLFAAGRQPGRQIVSNTQQRWQGQQPAATDTSGRETSPGTSPPPPPTCVSGSESAA